MAHRAGGGPNSQSLANPAVGSRRQLPQARVAGGALGLQRSWARRAPGLRACAICPRSSAGASTCRPRLCWRLRAQTVRQRMFPTVGGRAVRVRFSNEFGSTPLHVAAASVALGTGGQAVSPAALKLLSFGGRASITIAPGATVWSDAGARRRCCAGPGRGGQLLPRCSPVSFATAASPARRRATWVTPGEKRGRATPSSRPMPRDRGRTTS